MKMHENWMHDYNNQNTINFFVSVIELELQPAGFLGCHFFITLIKMTQMLIFTLFSQILDDLTEKL